MISISISSYLASFTLLRTDTLTCLLTFTPALNTIKLTTQDALTILQVSSEWTDVSLVDIVDNNGGHSDHLGRPGGHDRHQNEEQHGVLSRGAEQLLSHQRSSQTLGHVLISEHGRTLGRAETKVGEAHGGGQGEGDGEPDETTCDEAPDSLERFSSHRTLPVGLVTEHGAEVTNNVDNAEDEATGAEEGEVGATLVAHVLIRSLPAGDEVKHRLGVSKGVLRVVKRIVENLNI